MSGIWRNGAKCPGRERGWRDHIGRRRGETGSRLGEVLPVIWCLDGREWGDRLDESNVKGSGERVPRDCSSLWMVSLRFESALRRDCDFFNSSSSSVSDRSFALIERIDADFRLNMDTMRPLQVRKNGRDD